MFRTYPDVSRRGSTVAATEENIREAIRFHIDGLKEDGLQVPPPATIADYVEA